MAGATAWWLIGLIVCVDLGPGLGESCEAFQPRVPFGVAHETREDCDAYGIAVGAALLEDSGIPDGVHYSTRARCMCTGTREDCDAAATLAPS